MKRSLLIVAAIATLAAAVAGSTLAAFALTGPVGKPSQVSFYGHIKSLTPKQRRERRSRSRGRRLLRRRPPS